MIVIIDYGVGNLFSLKSSLSSLGVDITVSGDAEVIRQADKLILPGVGAFGDAREKLRETGLDELICAEARGGKPLLGICLGMQLLFEKSYEYGEHLGLGLLPGEVVPMEGALPSELRIPHIGWNALDIKKDCPLLKYVKNGECVYFVHSYYAKGCDSSLAATAEYGIDITATVSNGNIYGCQFHPEKSGEVGMRILKAFVEL